MRKVLAEAAQVQPAAPVLPEAQVQPAAPALPAVPAQLAAPVLPAQLQPQAQVLPRRQRILPQLSTWLRHWQFCHWQVL